MGDAKATATPQAWLALTVVLALAGMALYVMAADYFNLRQARSIAPVTAPEQLNWPQPWGGYGWRYLAYYGGERWRDDPATAARMLNQSATRYPLDSLQWLNLARIQMAAQAPGERIDRTLDIARAVQPEQRDALWSSTQIALQAGRTRLAEQQLSSWLRQHPYDTERALFIGARWIESPDELLERLLPNGREFLEQAMAVARRQQDLALADAVWQRLETQPTIDDPLFLDYIDLLLDSGQSVRAAGLWSERESGSGGGLFNGGFDRELGDSAGLNWRLTRLPVGVQVQRDTEHFRKAPASLAVAFNGKENIRLTAPWLRIPVEPGQRYQLSGFWTADGLTTRALPYLDLSAEGGQLRERLPIPASNLDWEPWSIQFTAPAGSNVVRLTLRRDPTQAFDRNIDGRLWLDELSLIPLPLNPISSVAQHEFAGPSAAEQASAIETERAP